MSLISIEGPSAVGKTTTSSEFAKRYNSFHIPEVNTWWKSPNPGYPLWFFERQTDRWNIAQENLHNFEHVVVDTDLFQPLWYNWTYEFKLFNNQSLEFVSDFYRTHIKNQTIGFPDKYFLLYSDEKELRKRKESDLSRRRGGFEMHLKLIESQKQYFQAINNLLPNLVTFIKATDLDKNIKIIRENIPSQPSEHTYSLELLDLIIEWLGSNKPGY